MPKTHKIHKPVARKERSPFLSSSDHGWTLPMDTDTLEQLLAVAEADVVVYRNELHNRKNAGRLEAIATVHNIMHIWEILGQPIKLSEICSPSGTVKKTRAKRKQSQP